MVLNFDLVAHSETCKEDKLNCEGSETPDYLKKVMDLVYIIS